MKRLYPRPLLLLAPLLTVAAGLCACGSSHKSGTAASPPPAASPDRRLSYAGERPQALPPPQISNAPQREGFTLYWEDNFESLDTSRWATASHTFTENNAVFSPSQVKVEEGYLSLTLDKAESPAERPYISGELRTLESFTYGRFETRARFASGSGVVSSFFTYYDHWADASLDENWNEIDIEFLGKDRAHIQWNVIHWNDAQQRTTHEKHSPLSFDPSLEFHDYAFEWTPDSVKFYIDDQLVHTQSDQVRERLKLESKIMMNVWPVIDRLSTWAGKFDESALGTAAHYDWVRVYHHTPG